MEKAHTDTGARRTRAVFLDLDGTIAAEDRPPAETVTAAIRRVRSAGHRVFLCTGRAPSYIYSAVEAIGFDGIVAAAGGYIRLGGRVLYRRLLEPETLRLVIETYQRNGKAVFLEGEEIAPGGKYAGQGVLKFTAYGPVGPERRLLEPALAIIEHGRYAEVVPAGVSKADGMRRVLEALGIQRQDSIAVGDSRNDLPMLAYAGIGVAMGGSPPEVLDAADRVTGTLAENGVASVLEELL